MKVTARGTIKFLAFILLLVIVVTLTFAAIFNIFDIPFPILNQPSQLGSIKSIYLEYPLNTAPILYSNGSISGLPLLSVEISYQYRGILVDGSVVNVGAVGYVYPDGQKMLVEPGTIYSNNTVLMNYTVVVGFEGAYYVPNPAVKLPMPYVNGEFLVNLQPENNSVVLYNQPLEVLQSVSWSSQGNYYPFIEVILTNGTTLTQTYPNETIYVGDSSIVQQEHYSNINTWLTIALFFFALVETPKFLVRLLPDEWQTRLTIRVKENQKPNTNATTENQTKTQESKEKEGAE